MLILIIDDNPDDRALVHREVLGEFPGAEVAQLVDLADLERALAGPSPALVVTDFQLRWSTGLEVLHRVRERHPDCPVVMFTGTGSEAVAVEAMKAGLDDYIVKSTRQLPRLRASMRAVVENAGRKVALRRSETQLRAALAHKDLLLRELHHRVKNNLLTVVSLLRLRARQLGDPVLRGHLDEIAGRMNALGAVQARVYETEELDRVDFRGVLEDVARSIAEGRGEGRVGLALALDEPFALPVQRASPLALLCHEFILNAVRHGFPEGRGGTVSVALAAHARPVAITVSDDGVGFDPAFARAGMGATLTRGLAAEAMVAVETHSRPGEGTTVRLILR